MNPKQSRYYTYIRPIMRNKFARTYSSLIFSIITISIFSVYAIRPTVITILSLQKSIDEQTQVLNSLKDKVNNLVLGKQNYENISKSTKDKLDNLIPNNTDLPGLINSLSFAAADAEATISGLQFQPTDVLQPVNKISKNAQVNQVDFTLNVQGEFSSLLKLLSNLERLDRLIAITNINFALPSEGALVMSITGKAYYLIN